MREMKDSGIEWIGCIPNNWGMYHLKYLCNFKTGGTPSDKMGIDSINIGYPWITPQDIIDRIYIENFTQYISQEAINQFGYKLFPPKSILLVCIASIGKVGIVRENCYANQQITALLPYESRVMPKFILYFVKAASQKIAYDASSNVVPIINTSYLKQFYCVVPSLSEQRRIASFLDAKCAEIDTLTADIQAQIDTLEQYKRSVITEAVTKGLNPDAEMKDCGIEWIGRIPAHWEIHPVYFYFGERKNRNRLGLENNLLSLSYGRIIQKDINTSEGLLPESFNTYNIVEVGDIIIRPTDLQNDKRSLRTGLVKDHGIITSAYIALYPLKELDTRYFHYLLHSFDVMKVFYNMGNGVRQGLNFSEFSRLMIFEPSCEEQIAIANFLDAKCAEIDEIITQKREQISTIEEYKKSLIFEYVTGKKEVI